MATTSMNVLVDSGLVNEVAMPVAGQVKRRRIDPKTGKALVALGHAIEYLANELVCETGMQKPDRGQMEAIQLMMAKNRDIYFACPEAPTFWQALRSLLHPNSRRSAASELSQSSV
jgi:hypothetical protein